MTEWRIRLAECMTDGDVFGVVAWRSVVSSSAIGLGCGDLSGPDFPEEGAWVDSEFFRCGFPVPSVALEGLLDIGVLELLERQPPVFGLSVAGILGPEAWRQVFGFDEPVSAEHERVFDSVFEFADIARKPVLHEYGESFIRDSGDLSFLEAVEAGDEMVHEQGDILASLRESGQLDGDHVDAVEEILPETAFQHQFPERAVGGRHDPHIHLYRLQTAERLYDSLLQHTQEPDLHGR
jgi:hypothetical protein